MCNPEGCLGNYLGTFLRSSGICKERVEQKVGREFGRTTILLHLLSWKNIHFILETITHISSY